MKWIIGDGHNIKIWEDHWIPGGKLDSRIAGSLMRNEENTRVSSLRVAQTWDLTSLHVPLPPQIEKLIHGILVARIARLSNTFVWPHNNGMCSVSWASHFIYQQQQQVPLDKQGNGTWDLSKRLLRSKPCLPEEGTGSHSRTFFFCRRMTGLRGVLSGTDSNAAILAVLALVWSATKIL
ncbi:hypothetical protein SO802_004912 [Lithocarpus litseifolius]|uniref:Reverse transcriptase zinc-binding domain-containing protein n=1 Tax=Lithocarpus litseifolius TaxID=425828 RepID=A0AAW2DJT2_9ROSI